MTTDFIGRGWAFPIATKDNGAIATVAGAANIEKAMRIVLQTHLGERPMRPAFGSRLRDFMFDAITMESLTAIEREVVRALTSCEPRIRVDGVVATASSEQGRVDIEVSYTVLTTNDAHNLVIPFYTIPGEES